MKSIIEDCPELIEDVMIPQLLARLLVLVNCKIESLQIEIMNFLGNLTLGDERMTQTLIDYGILQVFFTNLEHPNQRIRKTVAWALSNLVISNTDQL